MKVGSACGVLAGSVDGVLAGRGLKICGVCDNVSDMKNGKTGKIDISALNVPPERHEYETARYFASRGYDVIFIRPSNVKGLHNPDFKICNKVWETKSPSGESKRTFEDNFRKAIKQSEHIIIDLRRISAKQEKWCIEKLKKENRLSFVVKTLLVITRDGRLLTIKGKFDNV